MSDEKAKSEQKLIDEAARIAREVGATAEMIDAAIADDRLMQLREENREMRELLGELADSGLWLGGEEAGWTARIAALLDKHGRG